MPKKFTLYPIIATLLLFSLLLQLKPLMIIIFSIILVSLLLHLYKKDNTLFLILIISFVYRIIWMYIYLNSYRDIYILTGLSDAVDYNYLSSLAAEWWKTQGFSIKTLYILLEIEDLNSIHSFYYFYTSLIKYLIGINDYSVAFIDSLLSTFSVAIFFLLARKFFSSSRMAYFVTLVFGLLPSIIFFAPTMHKDSLILFMILFINYLYIYKVQKDLKLWYFIIIAALLGILSILRIYYVPIVILSILFSNKKISYNNTYKVMMYAAIFVITFFALDLFTFFIYNITKVWDYDSFFVQYILGSIKYIAPPLAWKVHGMWANYFIYSSSLIWLILTPFALLGAILFFINKPDYRFWVVQFVLIVSIAALRANLQGVRHRLQILPYLLIFAFVSIENFIKLSQRKTKGEAGEV